METTFTLGPFTIRGPSYDKLPSGRAPNKPWATPTPGTWSEVTCPDCLQVGERRERAA